MSKKKTKPALQVYWEEKLCINYEEEFDQYKKLCNILPLKENLFKRKNKTQQRYDTYSGWKFYILHSIDELNLKELKEYSRYLNQKYRENDVQFGLSQTLLYPFTICILSPTISYLLDDLNNTGNILFFVCFMVLVILIFYDLVGTREEPIYKHFYFDMKEIVNEKIETIESNEKVKE